MLRLEVGGGGRCFKIIIEKLRQVEAGLELLMREIEGIEGKEEVLRHIETLKLMPRP